MIENIPGFLASELIEGQESPLFHVIPVPLEQTVSYGAGTAAGPEAILRASQQLEAWDGISEPLLSGISTAQSVDCHGSIEEILQRIEDAVSLAIQRGAIPVVLGGEHTVSLGPIRVLAKAAGEQIGLVQLDAHADLRASYEGSIYSNACVMRRAVEECGCRLFQFGVRALCTEEVAYRQEKRIDFVDGRQLHRTKLEEFALPGDFPQKIYVTLDVDGLDPSVIGATGTPVPGGVGWWDTLQILEKAIAGRSVLGFDVVELAPRPYDHASDFAAAQLTYIVMGMIVRNLHPHPG
jgi:agmatinase